MQVPPIHFAALTRDEVQQAYESNTMVYRKEKGEGDKPVVQPVLVAFRDVVDENGTTPSDLASVHGSEQNVVVSHPNNPTLWVNPNELFLEGAPEISGLPLLPPPSNEGSHRVDFVI